mgnify:CR=1 FL=1
MSEGDPEDFQGVWDGLSYIVLGLIATAIFAFYGEPVNTGGVIASLAFVGIGVAAILAPKVSPLSTNLNHYWVGLFWTLCGLGILVIGLLSSHRWLSGVILGSGLVLYGALIALT